MIFLKSLPAVLLLGSASFAQMLPMGSATHAAASSPITHIHDDGGFAGSGTSHGGNNPNSITSTVKVTTFTYTATGAGNAVLAAISCSSSVSPTSVGLTATGWSFTQVGSTGGNTTTGFLALFKAYAPNTTAATLTATWTLSSGGCGAFMADLMVEFSGANGTNFIDASNVTTGASGCNAAGTVTPVATNDAIWFACSDNVSGTTYTNSYTKGGDDTSGDVASWKVLTGGAGVAQTPGYPTTTGDNVIWGVAITK